MTEVAQNAIDALSLGSLYALLALGVALIFGIMRLLNFAHGQLIMVGGYALWALDGAPAPLQFLGAILIVISAALFLELVAFRPLRNADPAVLLVSSFAVSFLMENLALVIFGGRAKGVSLPDWLSDSITVASLRIPVLSIVSVVAAAVLLAALALFFNRTSIGIQMRAAAESFSTARLLGVRANLVSTAAVLIAGVLAAIVAVLLTVQFPTVTPSFALRETIIVLAGVVVGGMTRLLSATLGGFTIGYVSGLLGGALPTNQSQYLPSFVFGLVILVLLIRPGGLFAGGGAQVERV